MTFDHFSHKCIVKSHGFVMNIIFVSRLSYYLEFIYTSSPHIGIGDQDMKAYVLNTGSLRSKPLTKDGHQSQA